MAHARPKDAVVVKPVAIQITYTGARLPKHVQLPVPFDSRCLQRGEVICNPIGTFPIEDGEALLALSGPDGLFQFHAYQYPDGRATGLEEELTDPDGRPAYRSFAQAKKAMKQHKLTHVHPERRYPHLWILVPDTADTPSPADPTLDGDDAVDETASPLEPSPATPDGSLPQEVA